MTKSLNKATSSDGYIYLLYLKWWCVFFLCLSIVGVGVLCPFYYFGSIENEKATLLQSLTVFEVSKSEWRVWVMLLISFGYSLIGYWFVYALVIKMKDFKDYEDEICEDDHDFKLAKRTVIIRNIPNYYSVLYSNVKLASILSERAGSSFEGVTTLGRYRNLFRLLNERIEIASRLNRHMNRLYKLQEWVGSNKTKKEERHSEKVAVEWQTKLKFKSKLTSFTWNR
jgi:Late exocytosis, associated with Golgi transport